jgi:hypothetical protein
MKIYTSILMLLAAVVVVSAADLKPIPYADNLLEAVSKPSEQQDAFIKEEAAKLAKSQVPTQDAAVKLAVASFLKSPGLDDRETLPRVVGLYRIGRDVTDFAKTGDLVWELRVSRMASGVSGVIWVSTTTKQAKVLFP